MADIHRPIDPKLKAILINQLGDPRSHFGWASLAMMVIFLICLFHQ